MTIYIIFVVMLYVEGLFSALFGSRLCNEASAVGCVFGCLRQRSLAAVGFYASVVITGTSSTVQTCRSKKFDERFAWRLSVNQQV